MGRIQGAVLAEIDDGRSEKWLQWLQRLQAQLVDANGKFLPGVDASDLDYVWGHFQKSGVDRGIPSEQQGSAPAQSGKEPEKAAVIYALSGVERKPTGQVQSIATYWADVRAGATNKLTAQRAAEADAQTKALIAAAQAAQAAADAAAAASQNGGSSSSSPPVVIPAKTGLFQRVISYASGGSTAAAAAVNPLVTDAQQIASLTDALRKAEKEKEELQAKLEVANKKLAEQEIKNMVANDALDEAAREERFLTSERDTAKARVTELEDNLLKVGAQLLEEKASVEHDKQTIVKLNGELVTVRHALGVSKRQVAELENQVASQTSSELADKLREQLKDANDRNEKSTAAVARLEAELITTQSSVGLLTHELAQIRGELEAAKLDRGRVNNLNTKLPNEQQIAVLPPTPLKTPSAGHRLTAAQRKLQSASSSDRTRQQQRMALLALLVSMDK